MSELGVKVLILENWHGNIRWDADDIECYSIGAAVHRLG